MATYEQKVIKYAKDLRADERALKGINPEAYGRIGVYRPIYNILINSVGELNLNPQTLVRAVNRGAPGMRSYIRDHKEYIRDQVVKIVQKMKGQTDRKFYQLLNRINKYEKTIEKQDAKIDKQEKKIGGLEKKIKKDAKKLKQAGAWKHKADTLDARVKVARDYTMSTGPMPDRDVLRYIRGR